MKCPSCEYNQKKKDGLKCSSCGYKFVLSPDAKIGDYGFSKLLNRCSKENTTYFTRNSIYANYLNGSIIEKKKQRSKVYGILSIISIILCFTPLLGIVIIPFLIFLGKWIQYKFFFKGIPFKEFLSYIPKWRNAKNKKQTQLNYLIDEKHLALTKAPQKTPENDIFSYGLEGIVFVDKDYYVDWLILNNFHFTYRVAVLSMNSYPNYLVPEIKQVIEKNPLLPIYFLHDGIITKTEIMKELNTNFSFEGQKYLIDIGLFSNDFMMIDFLKEKAKNTAFSKRHPLDTLQYSQLCTLFANAKSKLDAVPKTEEVDDDGEIIIMDDGLMIDVGLQNIDMSKRDMDLDFG